MSRARRQQYPENPLLDALSKSDGDRFKSMVDSFASFTAELRNLPPEVVAHGHSVLEAHKMMKKSFGYTGGVEGAHKLMKVK